MEKRFVSVDELCQWLGISRKTTERWRKDGMPYIKHGKLVLFDIKAVEDWLKSKEIKN